MRKAIESEEPVSTSVLMSRRSLPTDGLPWPLPTMSKAWSSGTPAFIMTASWRVKIEMSFSVTFEPPREETFFTLETWMPWRRSVAMTTCSPPARTSPLTTLPLLSLPLHE